MQNAIVAVIVAFAVWSVLRRYAPQALRRACRAWAARMARSLGWQVLERRIEAKADEAASCGGGCGPCKSCGPVTATPETRSAITLEALKQTIKG